MLGGMFGFAFLLEKLNRRLHAGDGDVIHALPDMMVFVGPMLFFSLILTGLLLRLAFRAYLGADDFDKLNWAFSIDLDYDDRRANRWLLGPTLLLIGLAVAMIMTWRLRVTSDTLEFGRLFGFTAEQRLLEDVDHIDIEIAAGGRRSAPRETPYFVIKFNDGDTWDLGALAEWWVGDANDWGTLLAEKHGIDVRPGTRGE